jgi:hypothetical protein
MLNTITNEYVVCVLCGNYERGECLLHERWYGYRYAVCVNVEVGAQFAVCENVEITVHLARIFSYQVKSSKSPPRRTGSDRYVTDDCLKVRPMQQHLIGTV